MILCGIGLNIINLYQMKLKDIPMLFLSILIEVTVSIYSLGIVLAKFGMDYKFCSPFEITFYEGIFGLILNIICLIISTNIPLKEDFKYNNLLNISEYKGKKYLDNFYTYLDKLNAIEVLLFIVSMSGRLLFNLFSHITIKHFTSYHVFLLLIMGDLSSLDWRGKNFGEECIIIVIFFIEFIMILIFCEIIELDFCGLEENTRKNILERAEFERYENINNENKSLDSNEISDGLELTSDVRESINENDIQ